MGDGCVSTSLKAFGVSGIEAISSIYGQFHRDQILTTWNSRHLNIYTNLSLFLKGVHPMQKRAAVA
jgi:hypothetical protein